MNYRSFLLFLLLTPSVALPKYDHSHGVIRVYGVKDYSGAFVEGFIGSMLLFYGTTYFNYGDALSQVKIGYGTPIATRLIGSITSFGGFVALGDAIRRVFSSAEVMVEISPEGLLCRDAGLVPWRDITNIECLSFTTVQYGRPFTSAYQLNVSTRESIPVEIDGGKLSESMNTVLTFVRKFYKGKIDMRKEVVQDITPRPSHGCYNNSNDSLVNLVQLGAELFGKDRR